MRLEYMHHMKCAVLASVALLMSPISARAASDDVVALTSGNRMTGQVGELRRGTLAFFVDGAGSVDINWNNVVTLESARELDIELASGERLAGSIASPKPGVLIVKTTGGRRALMNRDVVRITPIAATFRERTTGFVDLGLGVLSANDEIDLTLNGEAEHRSRNFLTHVALNSLVRERDDATDHRRHHLEIGSRRFLQRRWFALLQLEAEEDLELDLDSRFLLAGALGRTLLQSNRSVLAVRVGLDYALEDYRGIPGSDDFFEVLAGLEWDWFEAGGATELLTEATTYFSLDRSRVRVDFDTSLRRAFFRNVYWSLNLFESYDSDPPEGLEHSDFGLSLTLGTSF